MKKSTALICAAATALLTSPSAFALKAVANYGDWGVFVDGSGGSKVCFAATEARDKAPGAVSHGEVFFVVSSWKSGSTIEQPSFTAGYSLMTTVPPVAKIGRSKFEMFASENEAFAHDKDDKNLVRKIKSGSTLRMEAVSDKGTRTAYHFSLKGSTKAIEKSRALCR